MIVSSTLGAHALFALFAAASLGCGLRALGRCGRDLRLLERTALACGVGLGLMATAVLWLGLLDLMAPGPLALALAAMAGAGWKPLREWGARVGAALRGARPSPSDLFLGALALGVCAAGWLFHRLPPVFFDTLVYHLGLPSQYLLHGGLVHLPRFHYGALPGNAEMLYTLALGLGGEPLARLASWWGGCVLALSVAALARRFSPGAAGIGFVAAASAPVAMFLAAHNGSDHLAALWIFQALMTGIEWRRGGGGGWLVRMGLLLGFAAGTKYTALYQAAPFALLYLTRPGGGAAGRSAGARLRALGLHSALVALPFLAAAGPWYARNLIHTGNPVYPAFYSRLGGEGWSEASAERVGADVRHGAGRELTLEAAARIPWDLVMRPSRFGMFGEAGRMFWLFAAAAAWAAVRRPDLRRPAALALLALPFWLATSLNLRYLHPALAITFFLSAVGLADLARGSRAARAAVLAACALAAAANLKVFLVIEDGLFQATPALAGKVDRQEYLQTLVRAGKIAYYPAAQWVNQNLPVQARLLLVGETRLYYFERRLAASSAYDTALIVDAVRRGGSADGTLCELARQGITHLLYNQPEAMRLEAGRDYFSWRNAQEKAVFDALPSRLRLLAALPQQVFIFELPRAPSGCLPA